MLNSLSQWMTVVIEATILLPQKVENEIFLFIYDSTCENLFGIIPERWGFIPDNKQHREQKWDTSLISKIWFESKPANLNSCKN